MPDDAAPKLPPRLLNEDAAATYLGRSKTTFRAQQKAGTVPAAIRQGGRLYWDRVVLDRYVDALSGIGAKQNSWDE